MMDYLITFRYYSVERAPSPFFISRFGANGLEHSSRGGSNRRQGLARIEICLHLIYSNQQGPDGQAKEAEAATATKTFQTITLFAPMALSNDGLHPSRKFIKSLYRLSQRNWFSGKC